MWDTTGYYGETRPSMNIYDSNNDLFRNFTKNDYMKLDLRGHRLHTDSFRYLSFANNPNNSAKINISLNLNENSNYKAVKNSKIKRSRSLSKKSNRSVNRSKKRSGNLSPSLKPKKLKKIKNTDSEKLKLTKNKS
jgi:hypothetical protein